MLNEILQGVVGGLGRGFDYLQDRRREDEKLAQQAQQMQLQREQVARAIANDQAQRAHEARMEAANERQQLSLDDQRRFTQSNDLAKSGYRGALTPEDLAQLHPAVRAIATQEIARPEASGMVGLDGKPLPGNLLQPNAADWTPLSQFRQTESERLRIAELNNQQQLSRAIYTQGQANTRNTQDNEAAAARTAATIAGAVAAAAQHGQRGLQPRNVISGDANRIAEINSGVEALRRERQLLSEIKTGATSQLGAAMPNLVTEYTGWGQDAKKAQSLINLVRQRIGKALEGGVLRKEDELKYKDILATIGDDPELALQKLAIVEQDMEGNLDWTLNSLEDSNYDVSRHRQRVEGRRKGYAQPAPQAPTSPSLSRAIAGVSAPQPAAGSSFQRWQQRQQGGR
jgi:hypothetical protein